MRKFICCFLALISSMTMLIMPACKDDEASQSSTPTSIVQCSTHTGMVQCSNCGLQYFDELKELIMKNGTNLTNKYRYEGTPEQGDGLNIKTYIVYEMGNQQVSLITTSELPAFNATYYFAIMIPHPSESTALSEGKFAWGFEYLDASAIGILNGATFSDYTTKLTVSSQTGFKYGTSSVSSSAASYAQIVIKNALIPLLQTSEKGLTPANLGFTNYSLELPE